MFKRTPLAFALLAACLLAATPASAADPKEQMVSHTYQVADLVIPLPAAEVTFCERSAKQEKVSKTQATQEDALIEQVRQTVGTATWENDGGPGTIHYFAPTMSLVVKHTPQAHRQITALLGRLRKDQDTQVAIAVRFVSVADDDPVRPAPFLNDSQVTRFMEAVASDRRTCVTTGPKLTVFKGQEAVLNIGGGGEGDSPSDWFYVAVRPVVSADRRYVALDLDVKNEETKQTNKATVAVPDGGTVVLEGFSKMVDVEETRGVPVLKNIPLINRLFSHVERGREARRVFVLVTARVIVAQEEEETIGAKTSPVPETKDVAVAEEQEVKPAPLHAKALAELLRAYDEACGESQAAEAEKLARAALVLDPTCFYRKR